MNTVAINREGEANGRDASPRHPRSTPEFKGTNGCLGETSLPSGIDCLTDIAESLGFVPWLGEDVPRTIPNLLQRVLEGRDLSPAQSNYTLRLLTAATLELLAETPNTPSIPDPKSPPVPFGQIRNPDHTDPLFLRVAHRAAPPNLSTPNPQHSTTNLAAPTGPNEVQLDPSGLPHSERGTVGIFFQESGVRDQESVAISPASPANAPAPATLNTQPSTLNQQ